MLRLLMFVYLLLIVGERDSRPKTSRLGWLGRRKPKPDPVTEFLSLRASRAADEATKTPSAAASIPARDVPASASRSEVPKHKAVVEVIPASLVEFEAETAVLLQMPPRKRPAGRVYTATARDHYNSPIGRTLTREFIHRDPRHTPLIAIRHLPLEDAVRTSWHAAVTSPHPTSATASGKKGRATPKRPRRKT